MKEVYVILSIDKNNNVYVTAVLKSRSQAIHVVAERNKNFPDIKCWYETTALV